MVCYQKNDLFFGEKGRLSEIIQDNGGCACYVYDLKNVELRFQKLQNSLGGIENLRTHYAVKANSNKEILKKIKDLGLGLDVVSGGEMERAFDCGFLAEDIIFSGVGKSVGEISLSMDRKIRQINVESPQELERIGRLAQSKNKKINVAFRMNPAVNPITHPYITTGMSENKFGMESAFIPELTGILEKYRKHLCLRGLSMHIGSQLLDLSVIREATEKLFFIYQELQRLGFKMGSLDIGGGVGIHYQDMDEKRDFKTMKSYGDALRSALKDFQGEILIEPGRVLVARCGVLLCQVEYTKETSHKNFAILNTGMHHFMRPALYQAEHRILPLRKDESLPKKVYDLVGPVCESSDFLAKTQSLQSLFQGDFLAICDTGAYGYSMASNYNGYPLPKEFILSAG